MELIRLEDIHKTYHLGEVDVPVLRGISLSIRRGEMVALMGASGSGKTTLMNILGCLDHPTSGKYWLDGQEMSGLSPNQRALVRTEKLGFVFQSFNLLPRTTALQNVVMPLDYSPHRHSSAEARRLAQTLLDRVGLADRADHEPSQMSGGQQQRVAIGRALVNRPALVLADEPTGNLDSHTSVEILRMFQQLNAEGITVVLVTHDPKVAAYAHRTIRIVDGMIEGDETNPSNPREIGAAPEPHAGFRQSAPHAGIPDRAAVMRRRHGCGNAAGDGRAATVASCNGRPSLEPCEFYGDAPAKPRRRIAPALLPATWRTALGRCGEQDAVGAVGPGRHHRRGRGHRHDGDRPRLESHLQKSIASMGANTLMIFAGLDHHRRRQPGHRQRA